MYNVASALDYLHHHCETPIVHCDLKPSNILLDDEMIGHVSDFGLARILHDIVHDSSTNQSSSIGVKGTVGYTPPGKCIFHLLNLIPFPFLIFPTIEDRMLITKFSRYLFFPLIFILCH